jgi:hypothetical protein
VGSGGGNIIRPAFGGGFTTNPGLPFS